MGLEKGTEFKTKNGRHTFRIRALKTSIHIAAGQNLQRDKVDTRLAETTLQSGSEISIELARCCIESWVTKQDDGSEKAPLEGLDPKQQRELLASTSGIVDWVLERAKQLGRKEASANDFEDEAGNS